MARNQKLTRVIGGRILERLEEADGKLLIHFADGSTMTVKNAQPVDLTRTAGAIKAVRQKDTILDLDFEDGSTLEIITVEATASVMVRDKDHGFEYAD